MAHARCFGLALLALALTAQAGSSEGEVPSVTRGQPSKPVGGAEPPPAAVELSTGVTAAPAQVCAIYSLAEFADDPELAKWVAETIPEVIEPESWNRSGTAGGKHVVRYYGPKQVLVVYHTAAVQAKVDAFLKDLKKNLPGAKERGTARMTAAADPGVVPAAYQAAGVLRASPAPDPTVAYPVPAPAHQPKHLFHFIIRYEGAGIVDSNVVRLMKLQNGQNVPPSPPGTVVPSAESAPPPAPLQPSDAKPKEEKKPPEAREPRIEYGPVGDSKGATDKKEAVNKKS